VRVDAASIDDPSSGGAATVVSEPVVAVASGGDGFWFASVAPVASADFSGSPLFGEGSAVNVR
jgi:hypothetical protein